MADVEPAIPKSPQQEALPLHQRSPDLNVQPSHQPISVEGKEATIHDFLSLGGIKSASSSVDGAPNVLQSSITTQDLIYPLQKAGGRSNVLPADLVYGNTKPHISSVDYNAGRQTAYILVDDGVEKQPDYRSLDVSHLPKAHGPHDASISKHWQQKKRLSSVVSEDDDDEDDECLDHGYNSKREFGYHKFDTSQQPEGKNMDNKGLTPRSKHSATEQRRRSKINDRFQMLRQLLPYSDQKRDKASFLLEVIEHIQMLHNKVKKYEAAEHLGQPQEKPKAFPWDRASRCKEGVIDMSYGQPVLYNIKDKPDANGYMSYQSSPSRFGHRNGNTQIERTSNGAHASSFPNRLLQAPACLSSYGNSSIINTPAVLTFATRSGIHGEEPTTPTLFPTSSQSLPEPHTMFAQLVHQEEQAESRVKHSHSSEKTIALPDLHQSGISMAAQKSRFLREFDCAKLKFPEQKRPVTHIDRRANDHDMDEQLRSSTVKDLYQRNVNSTSNECEVDKGRTSYGLDGTPMDVNEKRPKEDPRREVVVHSQAQSAVPRGLLNVSSPYSQGLLDSLTQALQRSGVDLSQASISVQIDLGKSNGSAFTSSREIATLNTAMPPSQHSDLGHIQEPEGPITKRPKLEVDS